MHLLFPEIKSGDLNIKLGPDDSIEFSTKRYWRAMELLEMEDFAKVMRGGGPQIPPNPFMQPSRAQPQQGTPPYFCAWLGF